MLKFRVVIVMYVGFAFVSLKTKGSNGTYQLCILYP